jgi:hypothetical protein
VTGHAARHWRQFRHDNRRVHSDYAEQPHQAFDEHGEGLVLRGHDFDWDPERPAASPRT